MKKIKFILFSAFALATLGGALAFKANSSFEHTFCTRPIVQGPGACRMTSQPNVATTIGIQTVYTSLYEVGVDCTEKNCIISARLRTD